MHCPDITLKGRNQEDFQRALVRNVRHVLRRAGVDWRVGSARGRVHVETNAARPDELERAIGVLRCIAGISSMGAAAWFRSIDLVGHSGEFNWPPLEQATVDIAERNYRPDASFAIRANRVDKGLPVHSRDIGVRLGDAVRERTAWKRVDLDEPDFTIHVDAYPDGLYVYPDKQRGIGGLPVGTGGRVLALLSGGIDSPVAAFMMAKRGCTVDVFHMSASHTRDFDAESSVVGRLARAISRYGIRTRLHIVPYTFFDLALRGEPTGYELVLFRRFLMRCGEYLAMKTGAGALVTGDSLGQVASQTLENLASASRPVTLPILRPLIGMNKQEIIELARGIGTFDISIEPYKDCCALIARNPRTKSDHDRLSRLEADLFADYEGMIAQTFAETLQVEYDCGAFVGQKSTSI
ncbi:MAG TPA: tRNA uracil 4-sulfurtransferase ThiI [Gammaproteobacteria bacterium]|jgi:thiamine biosynthesis protein ThiI